LPPHPRTFASRARICPEASRASLIPSGRSLAEADRSSTRLSTPGRSITPYTRTSSACFISVTMPMSVMKPKYNRMNSGIPKVVIR
jgi:hypothetical protein